VIQWSVDRCVMSGGRDAGDAEMLVLVMQWDRCVMSGGRQEPGRLCVCLRVSVLHTSALLITSVIS
jgi:hypothetical protein